MNRQLSIPSFVLCLAVALVGLAAIATGSSPQPPPAQAGGFVTSWSIEFEPTCYVFDVDGSTYVRTVRPTYNAPPGYSYTESLVFALSSYQLEFGVTGNGGEIPGFIDPCTSGPPAVLTARQRTLLEARLAGDFSR